MSFSQMLEILQDKDSSKVVLIKLGHFYIATGRDAVLLHKKLNLKCTCFKNNICKVGIPVNSLEKYVEKFNQMQYSYIIYDYDKQVNEIKEIINKTGKACKIKDKNINCLNGSNNPASNRNTNSNNGSRPTLIQFLDYMFYGIYTMKVLVLKRFIPS